MEHGWNDSDRRQPMSATNLTWSDLVPSPGLCGKTEPWHGPEIHLQYTPTKNIHFGTHTEQRLLQFERPIREGCGGKQSPFTVRITKRISVLCGRYAASSVLSQAVHITTIWPQRVKQKHVHERIGCLVSKKLK